MAPVDKCLLLFMGLLLLQTAYSLFFNECAANADSSPIDVVMRTSAASIFGYFMSRNFCRQEGNSTEGAPPPQQQLPPADSAAPQNRIGFADSSNSENKLEQGHAASNQKPKRNEKNCICLQAVIATGIGLFSLVILLVFRNFMTTTPAAAATLSQLRDFVSGCIGFLIGCATGKQDES